MGMRRRVDMSKDYPAKKDTEKVRELRKEVLDLTTENSELKADIAMLQAEIKNVNYVWIVGVAVYTLFVIVAISVYEIMF